MAETLTESIFGTLNNLTNNFDEKTIEGYVGESIDSVDQFMSRTAKPGPRNYGRAFLAGIIGGLAGVAVKMIVDNQVAPHTQHAENKVAESAVQGIEKAAGKDLWNEDQEEIVETFLELGMGALIGGMYGLVVESLPDAEKIGNEQLMTTTQKLATPALGLIPIAGVDLANDKAQNLVGHTAFIGTVEIVRRSVRYALESDNF